MKRVAMLLTAIILISSILCPVSAANPPFVWDEANLLTDNEEQILRSSVENLNSTYDIDVMIVIKSSLDGASAQNQADDLYDFLGGGDDGVIFLLAMEEREWYISTCGDMIYALTDYGIQQLGEDCLPYLSSGNYFDAFSYFLELLPEYVEAYISGEPIDGYVDYSGDYYHGDQEEVVYYEEDPSIGLSLLIGIVVAVITLVIMRSSMNTKKRQHSAAQYLQKGSFKLTKHRDLFLYSNITKTKKQKESSSGGGSSVHRSSSGRSHGGGGGKF